jgi:hypothetical protein
MARTPKPTPKADPPEEAAFKAVRTRAEAAWTERMAWQRLYDEAYAYAVPFRRPPTYFGQAQPRTDRLFDNTAVESVFRFAGQLQQDLFGANWFTLKPGPLAEALLSPNDLQAMKLELARIQPIVQAVMLTGEFESSVHEMCTDLAIGTGYLATFEGKRSLPVRFQSIPNDEMALELGPYNAIGAIHWRTMETRQNLIDTWRNAAFPEDFSAENKRYERICTHQTWMLDHATDRWEYRGWVDGSKRFAVQGAFNVKPIATPRYWRVPGEAYGRGPALLALPATKTVNKAKELMLRAAAIAMLGIWAYRPGGFNPDTVRLAPGSFWPMGTTGGIMGPDVSRLDTKADAVRLGELIVNDERQSIRSALNDERLPEQGATPISATEIMARMRRTRQNYVGAYGRLVNEIAPPVVGRVIDIMHRAGDLKLRIGLDQLWTMVSVVSPIAIAMRMERLSAIIDFIQLVVSIRGPQALGLFLKNDAENVLTEIGEEMGVDVRHMTTPQERQLIKAQLAEAAKAMMAMQAQEAAAGQGAPQRPAAGGRPALRAV